MPPVEVPAGFKLVEKYQAMSSLELAAQSRHSRYAATANTWTYSGLGDPILVARTIQTELNQQYRWGRYEDGDNISLFCLDHPGLMVEISPQYHNGVVTGASSITMRAPLQKPGIFEKFLALFPIDQHDPSRFRSSK